MMRAGTDRHILAVSAQLPTEDCVQWPGSIARDGYGRAYVGGRYRAAHRLVYARELGVDLRVGGQLDHLCRNRSCVNPAHLEPVSGAENIARAREIRSNGVDPRTHCIKGHPMTAANTYVKPDGWRNCRECIRLSAAAYAARKSARKAARS